MIRNSRFVRVQTIRSSIYGARIFVWMQPGYKEPRAEICLKLKQPLTGCNLTALVRLDFFSGVFTLNLVILCKHLRLITLSTNFD